MSASLGHKWTNRPGPKIHLCPLLSKSDHPVVDERGQCVVRRLPHRLKPRAHRDLPFLHHSRRSRPSCLYRPGLRRAACARMMAARCGPRRANLDAMLKARGQSPARIAACAFESLVCNPASCGRRLYTGRARTSRRGRDIGGLEPHGAARLPACFRPPIRPGKAQGAFAVVV